MEILHGILVARRDYMAKILDGMELEEFKKEYQVEAFSIIVKIDDEKKKASYIIDGQKEIKGNYEILKKYVD